MIAIFWNLLMCIYPCSRGSWIIWNIGLHLLVYMMS